MASQRGEDDGDEIDAPSESRKSHEDQSENGKEGEYVLRSGDKFCSGVIILNLARNFAQHWPVSEAFRDLFQNWRDEGMKSFDLKHDDLIFESEDSKSKYEIRLYSRGLRRYLGYIRLNKTTGDLDITNYEACLTRENLLIGGSTKGKNANLAGAHGEGLKAASVVMVRNGHSVMFETSGFRLRFEFTLKEPVEFVCRIRKVRSPALQKKENEYKERRVEDFLSTLPESNICGDVTAIIGKVEFAEFKEWLKLCLDLEARLDDIKTSTGNIILDPGFSGRIYLKGLLLQNHPPIQTPIETPAKQFKYGYNLLKGEVDRDRRNLKNSGEEKGLAQTWIEAIMKDRAHTINPGKTLKPVKLFVNMLLEAEKHLWADVRDAQFYITKEVAEEMWEYLQGQYPKQDYFYHNQRNIDRDVETIKGSLKRKPVALPSSIWDPLSKFGFIWTPQQQQRRLLRRAPKVDIKSTSNPYYQTVLQTLNAAMALDERTRHLKLLIKTGDKADLDLLLDGSNVLMHERSLDFNTCHARAPCQTSDRALAEPSNKDYNHEPFLCDHVVIYLYGLLLEQLMPGSCYGGKTATGHRLRTKVSECVEQMPRNIEIVQGSQKGTIKVSWVNIASERAKLNGSDLKCRIILHESTCQRNEELLAQESIPENSTTLYSQDTAECGCPKQIVLQKDSEAYFCGLDLEKKYYPMVASQSAKAFYAPPPEALWPKQIGSDSPNPHGRPTSSPREARPGHAEEHSSDVDMHGVSSDSEDNMDIDSSWTSPYPQGSSNRTIPMRRVPYNTCTGSPNHLESDTDGSQFSDTANQASQKAPACANTDAEAGSVDSGSGDQFTPENAREYRNPRVAANPTQAELHQTRETPRNDEEGRQSYLAQTQESHPGHEGQEARPRASTSGPASESRVLEDKEKVIREHHRTIQQLQAANAKLQADLTASIQNFTSIQNKYARVKTVLAMYQQDYTTTLRSTVDYLSKRLADPPWVRQLPNMARTSTPAEPQENTSPAGLKREIIRDEGESSEPAAKRPKQGERVGRAGEASCQ